MVVSKFWNEKEYQQLPTGIQPNDTAPGWVGHVNRTRGVSPFWRENEYQRIYPGINVTDTVFVGSVRHGFYEKAVVERVYSNGYDVWMMGPLRLGGRIYPAHPGIVPLNEVRAVTEYRERDWRDNSTFRKLYL